MNNFFQKKASLIILFFIVFLAVFFRFNDLGNNPPSLDWDEASLGYNAYSILKTGADEYGNKFPLSFRSFDDFKPPLYVYLTVPMVALFGLNEFSVRLPSAVFGVLAIFATYFLVKEIFENWDYKVREAVSLATAFFLAVSPWHLQFSRAAFEGNLGLSFFVIAVLFLLKGLKDGKLLILSGIFFAFSFYSYHSFRLIVPLFILLAIIIFWKEIVKQKIWLIVFLMLLSLAYFPIFQSFFSSSGSGSRLSMVTIFGEGGFSDLDRSIKELEYDRAKGDLIGTLFHNRRIVYGLAILKGYFDHWNPDFLFLHGDGGRQHHAVNFGMLYLWDLPFILIGIHALANRFNRKVLLIFLWFLIAPLPSAISTGTPHPVRAIAMIPMFQIFTAAGVIFFALKVMSQQQFFKIASLAVVFFLFLLNLSYYLHQYYIHTPIEYGDFWQYGYKEAFQEASRLEKNYDKIIVTYKYDQPYIYYLFYNKINPGWYQKNWDYNHNGNVERFRRVIRKYEFKNINWSLDKNNKKTLFIAAPDEIPQDIKSLREIMFLDGTTAFRIVGT